MRELDELLSIARDAVLVGSDLVRTATPHQVRRKGDRDVVTDIDIKIEQEIRAYLSRVTPEIGFLGEEEGPSGDATEATWTLDPIDGTSNFARGLPLCAVSLGLIRNNSPVVAAITAPFLDLRYYATKGGGAFVNGAKLHASRTGELTQAIVSIGDYAVGDNADEKNRKRIRLTTLLAERIERVRMFGSAALDLVWVAEGRTDATVILSNKPWDTAAGVLIAREAGALVVDRFGEPHTSTSTDTIAVSPGIADELLAVVQAVYR